MENLFNQLFYKWKTIRINNKEHSIQRGVNFELVLKTVEISLILNIQRIVIFRHYLKKSSDEK